MIARKHSDSYKITTVFQATGSCTLRWYRESLANAHTRPYLGRLNQVVNLWRRFLKPQTGLIIKQLCCSSNRIVHKCAEITLKLLISKKKRLRIRPFDHTKDVSEYSDEHLHHGPGEFPICTWGVRFDQSSNYTGLEQYDSHDQSCFLCISCVYFSISPANVPSLCHVESLSLSGCFLYAVF